MGNQSYTATNGQRIQVVSDELDPLENRHSQAHGEGDFFVQKVVDQVPKAINAPSGVVFSKNPMYHDESSPFLAPPSAQSGTDGTSDSSHLSPQFLSARDRKSQSVLSFSAINNRVSQWRHSISNWASTSKHKAGTPPHEIQYSVFKAPPGTTPLKELPPNGFIYTGPVNKLHFDMIVNDAIAAIDNGVQPKRIAAGSSGSYFMYSTNNEIVGVFKPKDEEPYGPLSPKWTKWIHRNLFPCFFGRSCLIPNLGYICESAASLLDKQLQTYIVPYTDVVELSSDVFYYSRWEQRSARRHNRPLREKPGSFQLFLNGYQEADKFFLKYPLPGSKWTFPFHLDNTGSGDSSPNPFTDAAALTNGQRPEFNWDKDVILQFREELEKLVILDYIMRNTDRGLDNWMIRLDWVVQEDGTQRPHLKVGAIDSGLSWPWKHPDEWRSYPFGWLFLPASIIGQPFTEKTRNHFLPLLTSTTWWEECSVLFRDMFSQDSDFKERMWKKQWAVMKGQAFNVVETLKDPTHGPLELARRTRVMVWDGIMEVPVNIPISVMTNAIETPINSSKSHAAIGSALGAIQETEVEDEDECILRSVDPSLLAAAQRESLVYSQDSPPVPVTAEAQENDGLTFAQDRMATKKVIVERIQQVNSKPPVFTWC